MWFQNYAGIVCFADQYKLRHNPVSLLHIATCSRAAQCWRISNGCFLRMLPPKPGEVLGLSRTELSFLAWQKENVTGEKTMSYCWRATHWVKIEQKTLYKWDVTWFFPCLLCHCLVVKTDNMKHRWHCCGGEAPKPQAAVLPFLLPPGFHLGDSATGGDMRQLHSLWINSLWWAHSRRIEMQIAALFKPQVTSDLTCASTTHNGVRTFFMRSPTAKELLAPAPHAEEPCLVQIIAL